MLFLTRSMSMPSSGPGLLGAGNLGRLKWPWSLVSLFASGDLCALVVLDIRRSLDYASRSVSLSEGTPLLGLQQFETPGPPPSIMRTHNMWRITTLPPQLLFDRRAFRRPAQRERENPRRGMAGSEECRRVRTGMRPHVGSIRLALEQRCEFQFGG
jgi:hypothetical protein